MPELKYQFAPAPDVALVRRVLSHPRQFPQLETYCGADVFERIFRGWDCIAAREADELLGLYMLYRMTTESANIHVSLLPVAWGARARDVTSAFFDWLRGATAITRLVGPIDASNRLAVRFAQEMGMAQTGFVPGGLRKNGTLRDLAVFELEL